jgi:hypothetical protein
MVHHSTKRVGHHTWGYLRTNTQGVGTRFSRMGTDTHIFGRTSYVENVITEAELAATQPRIQERIKQVAARNAAGLGGGGQWNGFYSSPAPTPLNRLKRVGMCTTVHC